VTSKRVISVAAKKQQANEVSKVKGQEKLNIHIIYKSVPMLFTKNYQT